MDLLKLLNGTTYDLLKLIYEKDNETFTEFTHDHDIYDYSTIMERVIERINEGSLNLYDFLDFDESYALINNLCLQLEEHDKTAFDLFVKEHFVKNIAEQIINGNVDLFRCLDSSDSYGIVQNLCEKLHEDNKSDFEEFVESNGLFFAMDKQSIANGYIWENGIGSVDLSDSDIQEVIDNCDNISDFLSDSTKEDIAREYIDDNGIDEFIDDDTKQDIVDEWLDNTDDISEYLTKDIVLDYINNCLTEI